jgi:hypothetical protein
MRSNGEKARLAADAKREANWKRWGPYLSERQWATVREDYSAGGNCWDHFPHDHARSRAYRWGEDGLLGFTDRECRLCFALALWNGKDPILKERLFGLTGPEGNHGEDVKEQYFYLDATPTYSYMKALYKYPQNEFPYTRLVEENRQRGKGDREFEILDTGLFDDNRYFDITIEYAKNGPNDILIRITVANRGGETATLHLLPTVWFRNTWSWGVIEEGSSTKPSITLEQEGRLSLDHESLGHYLLDSNTPTDSRRPIALFTDNNTNTRRLYNLGSENAFFKDAFNEYVIHGKNGAVNPARSGTKAALHYVLPISAQSAQTISLRLFDEHECSPEAPESDAVFAARIREADEYYASVSRVKFREVEWNVVRQAAAGLLWSKQFYHYVVADWLAGDPAGPAPAGSRLLGRNKNWTHVYSRDVISMPDKWEYPWFAAWDLGFHMIPLAHVDPQFAKEQLILLLREWYMHPNGQIPAYEFAFGDVNPPVHAWAAWRVYKISGERGERDRDFLESVFQKLLLNFTWWVNRKDADGENLFSGGFLGLDNIGAFDRSQVLPNGATLRQADGTAWMAFYCITMLEMALELASGEGQRIHKAYEDMASKFLEHFIQIADAMNKLGGSGLWDDADGFYYDQVRTNQSAISLKTRSMVGLLPLIAGEVFEEEMIKKLPGFYKRTAWFARHRPDLAHNISFYEHEGGRRFLLAIPSRQRLERVLSYMLDEKEFLSPYGIRSLSKFHEKTPCIFNADGVEHRVDYDPGESRTHLFGGNSNWRGPIWFPVNYLLIEALERYHHFYGDTFQIEFPTGSGRVMNLQQVASELGARLASIFLPDATGRRPCHGDDARFATDPHWRDLVLFHEYFHGETGRGLGANHQTGWTALVIRYVADLARQRGRTE